MNRMQLEDLLERAFWSFCWGTISSAITLAPGLLAAPNLSTLRAMAIALLVGSISAGLSAAKTFVKTTM